MLLENDVAAAACDASSLKPKVVGAVRQARQDLVKPSTPCRPPITWQMWCSRLWNLL